MNARADAGLLRALAEELIGMGAAIVGFKLGSQGMYLLTTSDRQRAAGLGAAAPKDVAAWTGRELLAPCFVVEVVGTTGSGDCTIAGFLGGFVRGLPPEKAMTAAVAVGACNVEAADATSGILVWSEVRHRISAGWKRRSTAVSLPGWQWDDTLEIWRSNAEKH